MSIPKRRSFGRLTKDTLIRGVPAAEWDAVFTGGLEDTLRAQRVKVEQIAKTGAPLDVSNARLDVATSAKRLKTA